MARLDRIENGNDYDKFSTNELYLRQEAVQDDTQKIYFDANNEKEQSQIKAIQKMGLELTDGEDGQYITIAQLVELNEIVEKEKFGNNNEYDDEQVQVVVDMIDEVVQQTKTDSNTQYGQDALTAEQKARAELYMGEGAENVKNIYLKNAEILRDKGYWNDATINERLEDIMNGDRLIGESYGVMMDELQEYGVTDSNNNIIADWYTDEESGVNSYKAETNLNLSEENQSWTNAPTYINDSPEAQGYDDSSEDNSATITDIKNLLYGDGNAETTGDNAVRTDAKIKFTTDNDEEVEVSVDKFFSEENLSGLDKDTLSSLKSALEDAQNAAGKINLSKIDSEVLNNVYKQSSTNPESVETEKIEDLLSTRLSELANEDDYYQAYVDALNNGEMTAQEIIDELNAEDPELLGDLEEQLQNNKISAQAEELLSEVLGNEDEGIKSAIADLEKLSQAGLKGDAYKNNLKNILGSIDDELSKLTPKEGASEEEIAVMNEARKKLLDELSDDDLKTINNVLNTELEPNEKFLGCLWETKPAVYAGDQYKNIAELFTNPDLTNVDQITRLNDFYKNNEDAWGSDKFHNNLGEMLADSENTEIHNLSKNDKQTLLNMFTLADIEMGTLLGNTPVSSIFMNILEPDTSNPQSVIDSIDLRHYYIGRLNASPDIVNKELVKNTINTPLKETLENISDTETIKNIIITKGEGSIPWLEEQLKDIVGDNYSETVGGVLFKADGELEADENYDLYASSKKEEDEEEEDN